MTKGIERLKPLAVDRLAKPGRYSDGGGLYLFVGTQGRKSWVFRYTRSGKAVELGLGGIDSVPLVQVRRSAADLRAVLAAKGDPKAHRARQAQLRALVAAKAITFEAAARACHALRKGEWGSESYAKQWLRHLELHAFPVFGNVAVGDVDRALVVKALDNLTAEKPRVAELVRANIQTVFDYSHARGDRTGENPARWAVLKNALSNRKGQKAPGHFRSLPYSDVPSLFKALSKQTTTGSKCLLFTLLTAVRTADARGAKWSEIDLEANTWTIPAERLTKGRGKKEHRVPLTLQAIALLKGIERINDIVFIGNGGNVGLSTDAMRMSVKRMGWQSKTTVHGFRAAFRTWAAETTDFPEEVIEAALAHSIKSKVIRAYQRGDMLEKRRLLMAAWGSYCAGVANTEVNVVQFNTGSGRVATAG